MVTSSVCRPLRSSVVMTEIADLHQKCWIRTRSGQQWTLLRQYLRSHIEGRIRALGASRKQVQLYRIQRHPGEYRASRSLGRVLSGRLLLLAARQEPCSYGNVGVYPGLRRRYGYSDLRRQPTGIRIKASTTPNRTSDRAYRNETMFTP
ncbi:uncharacterized protein [Dermacentor albipictus]|uniref:uncharacterized protein n=1 Tax=Dermacentor albipictus TaxID=60249 RepID=UPI0031FC3367